MKLPALAIVLVALGIVLGLAFRGMVFEAGAAPPPPAPTKVLEQNLDSSGLIRVHEQGTANVNVVSMPPETAPTGRLIELGTQTVGAGEYYKSPFVDVSDCKRMTLMAAAPADGFTQLVISENWHLASPDGVRGIPVTASGGSVNSNGGIDGLTTVSLHDLQLAVPFMKVLVGKSPEGAVADITAWIWCAP